MKRLLTIGFVYALAVMVCASLWLPVVAFAGEADGSSGAESIIQQEGAGEASLAPADEVGTEDSAGGRQDAAPTDEVGTDDTVDGRQDAAPTNDGATGNDDVTDEGDSRGGLQPPATADAAGEASLTPTNEVGTDDAVDGRQDAAPTDEVGTDDVVGDGLARPATSSIAPESIAALAAEPLATGWNGAYTAPGSGVVATVVVAADAGEITKVMVRSSQWSSDGVNWSTDDMTVSPGGTYYIYTPMEGWTFTVNPVVPNVKADVTLDMDPAITTACDYFLFFYANGCNLLTSLGVPDTSHLTSAGYGFMRYYAKDCSALTQLGVPDTSHLTTVGEYSLYGYALNCSNVTSLATPDLSSLTSIPGSFMSNYAMNCSSLTELAPPDTSHITSVGAYFLGGFANGCTGLTTLDAPDTSGFTSVGSDFLEHYAYGCSGLTYLGVPDTSHITGGSYFMCEYATGCSALTQLAVPDTRGFTSSGDYFMESYARGCSSLTRLEAPDTSNMTSAGNFFLDSYAMGCSSLKVLGVPDTTRLTSSSLGSSRGYFMYAYASGCNALDYLTMTSGPYYFDTKNVSWQLPAAAAQDSKGLKAIVPAASLAAWQALTADGRTLALNQVTDASSVYPESDPDGFAPTLTDPVWGDAFLYGTVVTTWTNPEGTNGLKEALDKVGAYE
ncbi:MAG: hypothetical protein LBR00_05030, partial [Clostridiales Family XIII bacterium]|nr:hypothetical protein [Clostridiales Family XIII bacterium]